MGPVEGSGVDGVEKERKLGEIHGTHSWSLRSLVIFSKGEPLKTDENVLSISVLLMCHILKENEKLTLHVLCFRRE